MKRQVSTEAKLGIALAVILLAIGTDAAVREMREAAKRSSPPPEPVPQGKPATPSKPAAASQAGETKTASLTEEKETGIKAGKIAPDFSLPGEDGKTHHLRDFSDKRTILAFFCGCARCAMMSGMLQRMRALVADQRPHYLAVTTMSREALPSWRQKTEFDGVMLVSAPRDPVIQIYGGHPCPRVYVLDEKQRVLHVSPPPTEVRPASEILNPLAKAMHSVWVTTPEIESGAPVPTYGEITLNRDRGPSRK